VASLAAQKTFHSWLFGQGWLALGWPEEFGGSGEDVLGRAAVYDMFSGAGIYLPPTINSAEIIGPTLRRFAPDLARAYVPRLVSGAEAWCQGFSEPEAGSDLAALRMRGARDGGTWTLNGQKIWSTRALGSDRCVALVRTGTAESRHHGLTMFLVDMDAPGVECRAIDDMAGTQHFGEVFFIDVTVSDDRRIGDVGQGWQIAQYLLQWERGMYAWLRQGVLHGILRELDPGTDRARMSRLGEAYQDVAALRLRSLDTIRALADGVSDGPQVSIDKLLLSRAERSVYDLADATWPVAVDDGSPQWPERLHDFLHSRVAPIYGGSAQIQRTIIATQILGLGRNGTR
jgi:alkylation response protein AidB-like acyl-CoA dehydrogenase